MNLQEDKCYFLLCNFLSLCECYTLKGQSLRKNNPIYNVPVNLQLNKGYSLLCNFFSLSVNGKGLYWERSESEDVFMVFL